MPLSLRNPRNLVSLREGRNESALGVFFDVIWILIQDISLQVQIPPSKASYLPLLDDSKLLRKLAGYESTDFPLRASSC